MQVGTRRSLLCDAAVSLINYSGPCVVRCIMLCAHTRTCGFVHVRLANMPHCASEDARLHDLEGHKVLPGLQSNKCRSSPCPAACLHVHAFTLSLKVQGLRHQALVFPLQKTHNTRRVVTWHPPRFRQALTPQCCNREPPSARLASQGAFQPRHLAGEPSGAPALRHACASRVLPAAAYY